MNNKEEIPPRFVKLFEFLTTVTFEDGGDGDGIVILRYDRHDTVASWFEQYLHEKQISHLIKKHTLENGTLFSDERNENFVFTNDQNYTPRWHTVLINF